MDRNSITGIIIIAIILIGYSFLTKPSKDEIAERQRIADSIRVVQEEQARRQADEDVAATEQEDTIQQRTGIRRPERDRTSDLGVFASMAYGSEEYYVLENSKLKLTVSKLGGKPYSLILKEYQTHDSLPLVLFSGDSTIFGLEFFSDGRHINTNELYFNYEGQEDYLFVDENPENLVMRLPVDTLGAYIEYTYTLSPDEYLVDFNVRMKDMDVYRTDNVQLRWEIFSPQQERGRENAQAYTNLLYRFNEGDVEKFKARSKKELQDISETTQLEWVAYKQQFFSSVLIADEKPFEGGYMASEKMPESSKYINHFMSELDVPYDRTGDFVMPIQIYFGPNHFKTLKNIGHELEELVTLGRSIIGWINRFIIIPIFNWLNNYFGNYGLIILLLTIIIKVGLLPLTYRSYMSQAKMRALKPEIDEVNKKIPKEKAMERQQATMALYKKAGVNPMGGCLPMLLQMPILYAMFRFFPSSIELRQEKFLWANDLSTYDSILDLPFSIPLYGDHVSLFTILMTVTTILSMRMSSATGASESQMPGMKGMMYIMPVMFMLILNNFSAGLTYYYFLANVITVGQNYLFKQFVDEEELRKKLHAKKAKPTKKSGFQKRLEEMAKQRGYNMPKK